MQQRSSIFVDSGALYVPLTAREAVAAFRCEVKARRLWTDSVCINQADVQERSQQVAIMGSIFRGGGQNLIFLGAEDDLTRQAHSELKFACLAIADATDDFVQFKNTLPRRSASSRRLDRWIHGPTQTSRHSVNCSAFLGSGAMVSAA